MELLRNLPWRRAVLAVVLNLLALSLSTTALLGSYWCVGTQKVPKPLCGKSKTTKCIGVPMPPDGGTGNSSFPTQDVVHYSWETGDDRFAFRYFHTGMWVSCEENIEGSGSRDESVGPVVLMIPLLLQQENSLSKMHCLVLGRSLNTRELAERNQRDRLVWLLEENVTMKDMGRTK
ncbi:UNVERIFIED_CONTAM: hypothetical protein K2H54_074487 [Gekko kuhli]